MAKSKFEEIDGVRLYTGLSNSFYEDVPKLMDTLTWWNNELEGLLILSKSKTGMLCRVHSPFNEFKVSLSLRTRHGHHHYGTQEEKERKVLEGKREVVAKAKQHGQTKVYIIVDNFANVQYWMPGMGFELTSTKGNKIEEHDDISECLTSVCKEVEAMWEEINRTAAFFIAANSAYHVLNGGNE